MEELYTEITVEYKYYIRNIVYYNYYVLKNQYIERIVKRENIRKIIYWEGFIEKTTYQKTGMTSEKTGKKNN